MFTGRLRSEIPLSLEFIVQALQGKPVRLLDLSDNAFGPDGLRPLVPLISRLPTLQVLRLHNTGLGPQGGQLLAEALSALAVNAVTDGAASAYCDAPVAKGPLRELVVGRSRLENGSMAQLASALRQHPQLQVLVLPQNGIRPEGS
jgi:Ran GTPase-activating protein 1